MQEFPQKNQISGTHFVTGHSLFPPWPLYHRIAVFGMGCFWGAEKLFWQQKGVWVTICGYSGGYVQDPHYKDVCSGTTGHMEVVKIVYNSQILNYWQLLTLFWENHQVIEQNRQGNDIGTQYQSCIIVMNNEQKQLAIKSKQQYQLALKNAKILQMITTNILDMMTFYYAESHHQQYLAKNPDGYCGLQGHNVSLSLE